MFVRFLWIGLMAGIVAGVPTAAIQHVTTTPLILTAEIYEEASPAATHAAVLHMDERQAAKIITAGLVLVHDHGDESHDESWAPEEGVERTFYTAATTIVTTIGYAFMLLAAMFLSKDRITPRTGLLWGVAGFAAVGLAPSLGLSPELPGTAAADVNARQIWWTATVFATATGLCLVLRISSVWAILLGLLLMGMPHIIGAPHPEILTHQIPSELAAQFASRSLVLHAITWALAGSAVGYLWNRQGATADV